jgi:hypothetical protein
MLSIAKFGLTSTIKISEDLFFIPPEINKKINSIWDIESKKRDGFIFNKKILSAVTITDRCIYAKITEYRNFIAQKICPELFETLQVKPIAVSGILKCPDGLLFGLRASSLTQDPGLWELLPSGGIDPESSIDTFPDVDHIAQLLIELQEEVGLTANNISHISPLYFVNDSKSHVIDIVSLLECPLTFKEINKIYSSHKQQEVDDIKLVAADDLAYFIESQGDQISEISKLIIKELLSNKV